MGAHHVGKRIWPDYTIKGVTKEQLDQLKMIDLTITKNDLGLHEAVCTATPYITVTRAKADRDDLEYELRRAFEELVGEVVTRQLKEEF